MPKQWTKKIIENEMRTQQSREGQKETDRDGEWKEVE